MSVGKFALWTVLVVIAGSVLLFAVAAYGDPAMGSTSKWGIVYSPCAWCGTTKNIEVHHVYMQSRWPERAYDTNNMVCLCRRCHLALGHRGCFTNAVTNLVRMIEEGRK